MQTILPKWELLWIRAAGVNSPKNSQNQIKNGEGAADKGWMDDERGLTYQLPIPKNPKRFDISLMRARHANFKQSYIQPISNFNDWAGLLSALCEE